jgi:predicted PurR-regulated permease PerM/phosphoglycolate phosphatase-like HAD superfamily hydrolase
MNSRRWSNVTKIIVAAALAILAIVLVITFRAMIPSTIVAFLLTFVLSYPVNWLQRRTGWSRGAAVGTLYLAIFVLLTLTPALAIPRLLSLLTSLQETLEQLIASLQTTGSGFLFTLGNYHLSLDNLLQQVGDALQNVLLATANPLSIFRGVTNGVVQFVYVLVVNFWLLTDLQKLRRALYEQIPADYQDDMRRLAEELGETWQAFLRGQIVLSLVVGLLTWAPLAIIGMPNAGGLAILAGVMEFLPNIGQGISGVIGALVAIFQGSTWLPVGRITFTIIVLIIYAIIAQVENVYLVPQLVGGRLKLHPAVAFVGTVAGALVFGVLGVLLATPVIASARVILVYIYRKLLDLEPFEPERASQSGIRIRGLIAGRKIEGLIIDLDGALTALNWEATHWAVSYFYWLDRTISIEGRKQIARRLMVRLEGSINFLLSQILRFGQPTAPRFNRLLFWFDRWRGYPTADELAPLPGVVACLRRLAPHYQLALITTRDRQSVERFLARHALQDGLFATVLTHEESRNLLPHGEGLLTIARRLQLQPNQLLMVSDSDVNLRAARAMQMATVGVLSGLGNEQDMRDADLTLNSVVELEEWL